MGEKHCQGCEMRQKGLVLPGYACRSQIWDSIRVQLDASYDVTWVDWPHELTAGFHSVTAFADWLYSICKQTSYDFVIGHSMGGLVALELAQREKSYLQKIVLVVTYLLPPKPFFQNLFLNSAQVEDSQLIIEMLGQEKEHYSPKLQESLRQVDPQSLVVGLGKKFHILYGGRGCGDTDQVMRELAWPQEIQQWVDVKLISNACHFPMIENSEMTTQLLQDILE